MCIFVHTVEKRRHPPHEKDGPRVLPANDAAGTGSRPYGGGTGGAFEDVLNGGVTGRAWAAATVP